MDSAIKATLNDPHKWYLISPNMPIYFCAIFIAATLLDLLLQR